MDSCDKNPQNINNIYTEDLDSTRASQTAENSKFSTRTDTNRLRAYFGDFDFSR